MKINNVDVKYFLKNNNLVLNRRKSLELSHNKPSIKRKHVKSPTKVSNALLELEENHNWSWYNEIKDRWKACMEKPMTFYRGYEKSGEEVFAEADALAISLRYHGIEKGDDLVACMSNVPEVLTLLLAASKCGAKVKFIGSGFDKDFLNDTINKGKKKIFIGTDDEYGKISNVIQKADFKNIVLVSLTDSLEKEYDPYQKYDEKFYQFKNKVGLYKEKNKMIKSFSEFKEAGRNYTCTFPKVGINDEFTATYTSGSTKIGWPKTITHLNKHYISIARFHDPDLSRMPAMRNMRGLAHIPTHSNTNIASSISDTLCQMCTVAFEPIYDPNFFAYSLTINQPGFVPATRSFWLKALECFKSDDMIKEKDLSYLLNAVAVGEDIVSNEVDYINKRFKELKAGSGAGLPSILTPITLSIGGGNCEHGGLFFTLFKSLREKVALRKSSRHDFGLTPFQLAEVAVLRDDGTECDYEEIGNLVANSNLTMKEYESNEEATHHFFIDDQYDRTWGNCNVWSYIGKNGNVVMKGRKDSITKLSNGKKVPNFLIAEEILKDKRNILSCEVVTVKDEEENDIAVAHIKLQKNKGNTMADILMETEKRCQTNFSEELDARIIYRVLGENEDYDLTKSGKRSLPALEDQGINDKCVKPVVAGEFSALYDARIYLKNYTQPLIQTMQFDTPVTKTKALS